MLLITGANGQLGQELTALCQRRGIACRAYSRQALDICNQARVKACFDFESFDCVINCAAYTAVDAAESDPQTAFAVNADGPRILAKSGVPVIHVSTDYVFDGKIRHRCPRQSALGLRPQQARRRNRASLRRLFGSDRAHGMALQ